MQLSEHFKLSEFGDVPESAIPAFQSLCTELLEPIRTFVNSPIRITSGYRSPEKNLEVGGTNGSQHVATSDVCAADFTCKDMPTVYDWIRLMSGLRFDQVILERDKKSGLWACIHISWTRSDKRRIALVGSTKNQSGYYTMKVNPIIEA